MSESGPGLVYRHTWPQAIKDGVFYQSIQDELDQKDRLRVIHNNRMADERRARFAAASKGKTKRATVGA